MIRFVCWFEDEPETQGEVETTSYDHAARLYAERQAELGRFVSERVVCTRIIGRDYVSTLLVVACMEYRTYDAPREGT